MNWTRLSCHKFVAKQVRMWLSVSVYPPKAEVTLSEDMLCRSP